MLPYQPIINSTSKHVRYNYALFAGQGGISLHTTFIGGGNNEQRGEILPNLVDRRLP